jgi:predicted nuclease with RNAse H fold
MTRIGIDLAGPSNLTDTAMVALNGEGDYLWHATELGDRDLLGRLGELDRLEAVGLDAPLSYNPGGGDRPADRALRAALTDAGGRSSSVMPPTMTRMAYLTLRGMTIARLLEDELGLDRSRVAEVHPASALVLRGAAPEDVAAIKESKAARRRIAEWMGLPEAVAGSDHLVAAAAAALAVVGWQSGAPAFRHPADRPHHPYDVVA